MRHIDEYRDKALIAKLTDLITRSVKGDYTFMEVCGGHTAAIQRFGLPSLLPENIRLISGPGCPVCVTETDFIDRAIAMSRLPGVIITTFGDLMRVPGSVSSLLEEKTAGADVRIVLSGLEALEIARNNTDRIVIFTGIGFETTAPGTAVTVRKAAECGSENFFVLSAHKVMPPAMEAVIKEGTMINGFICPGHVSVITGASAFRFIPEKYRIACVITGFEPSDLLQAILMLISQVNRDAPAVEIQYSRAVTPSGNISARSFMEEVFEITDTRWRGFGVIGSSGLALRQRYQRFDAAIKLPVNIRSHETDSGCICGEILRGIKRPSDCLLFAKRCLPDNPVGACMVSAEGACHSYYNYSRNE